MTYFSCPLSCWRFCSFWIVPRAALGSFCSPPLSEYGNTLWTPFSCKTIRVTQNKPRINSLFSHIHSKLWGGNSTILVSSPPCCRLNWSWGVYFWYKTVISENHQRNILWFCLGPWISLWSLNSSPLSTQIMRWWRGVNHNIAPIHPDTEFWSKFEKCQHLTIHW